MLKCKECGLNIEATHNFCGQCGAKQSRSAAEDVKTGSSGALGGLLEDSIAALRTRAQSGDTSAMYELCILHGCAGQQRTAYRLLRTVALAGDVRAQAALGTLLMEGIGCDVDETEGREWLDRAASQGYAPAQLQQTISILLRGGRKERRAARQRMRAAGTRGEAVPQSWEDYL